MAQTCACACMLDSVHADTARKAKGSYVCALLLSAYVQKGRMAVCVAALYVHEARSAMRTHPCKKFSCS